jgi:hypothetical protein
LSAAGPAAPRGKANEPVVNVPLLHDQRAVLTEPGDGPRPVSAED